VRRSGRLALNLLSVFLPGFAGRLGSVKMIVRRDVVRARGFAASFADV